MATNGKSNRHKQAQPLDEQQISYLKEIRMRELEKSYSRHTRRLRNILRKLQRRQPPTTNQ